MCGTGSLVQREEIVGTESEFVIYQLGMSNRGSHRLRLGGCH